MYFSPQPHLNEQNDKYLISYSALQSWKRCRRHFWFGSRYHHNLKPREDSASFQFGKAFHEVLAEYHKNPLGGKPEDLLYGVKFPSAEEQELGTGMINHYIDWFVGRGRTEQAIGIEYPFAVPIPAFGDCEADSDGNMIFKGLPVYFYGVIDLILQRGLEVIPVDHKTCSSFRNQKSIDLDEQMTGYLWSLRELGHSVSHAYYDEIRKTAPAKPKVLASGKLSTDKRQLVTLFGFMDMVLENEEKHSDYQEFIDFLETRPDPFIRRTETYRSEYTLDRYGEQLALEAHQLLSTSLFYPSPSWSNCNSCAFYDPCYAMNNGDDWQFILDDLYVKREDIPTEVG